jgi:hypothetical protein
MATRSRAGSSWLVALIALFGTEAAAGPTITVTGKHYTQKKLQNLAPNTTVDCSKATFYLGLADKTTANNYILQVRSSVDTLVKNVLIIGDVPLTNSWNDQYKNNNSAAFSFMESHGGTLENAKITRSWDALRAARDTKGSYIFRRVYIKDWRDDLLETDTGYPNTLVEDCLFDGGYSGFSSRQGANSSAGDASSRWLRIRKVLLRLKKFPGNKNKTGSALVHNCPMKLSGNCQSIEVTDSVFAIEHSTTGCWGSNWKSTFKNKLKVSKNNLFLWLGSGSFPSSVWVPPGFTALSGQKAKDEWNKRSKAWLAKLGGGTSPPPPPPPPPDAGVSAPDAQPPPVAVDSGPTAQPDSAVGPPPVGDGDAASGDLAPTVGSDLAAPGVGADGGVGPGSFLTEDDNNRRSMSGGCTLAGGGTPGGCRPLPVVLLLCLALVYRRRRSTR